MTDDRSTHPFNLNGNAVWVTGAGKGLGRAMAVAMARAGATVAATARTEGDLAGLADELSDLGGKVLVLPGSVDDPRFVADAVGQVVAATGRLDTLVNCAGISPVFTRSERLSDEDWHRVISVNLAGTFFCCREAGKVMLEQGAGSIINISSIHGHVGFERMAAYAASKGGVEALTRTLAVEWADRGVRVNAIAPGYFRTELSSGLLDSAWGERILSKVPLGRLGEPDELTSAVVYLASDASRYVTGTTVFVDGGWTAQ